MGVTHLLRNTSEQRNWIKFKSLTHVPGGPQAEIQKFDADAVGEHYCPRLTFGWAGSD